MTEVSTEAIDRSWRERFVERANAQIAAMQRDHPEDWAALRAEDRLWEATLMDGLEDEPPYFLASGDD